MKRQTLLAILQQSEYDPHYFIRWWRDHHREENLEIIPKKWTTKLRLIDQIGRVFFWLPDHEQLLLTTWLLSPLDWLVRMGWLLVAKLKLLWLKKKGLKVIAFAGSYGKTSTKKIALHVFNGQTKAIATPKSINTPMGIAKFIMDHLTSESRVFLVELGEYYRGDVATLTRFVTPDFGVVTPAGRQHLERMHSLGTIAQTILELAEYFHYQPSRVIIHESLVPYLPAGLNEVPLTYGVLPASDYTVNHVQVSWAGTEAHVRLTKTSTPVQAFTPLFGGHQLVNSLPALWLTQMMGLDQASAVRQLGSTPYVPHRHQPLFTEGNILILDNGYNSNPDSATISLELLKNLTASNRIVITPGFVELGDQSTTLHEQFGKQLAQVVDYLGLIESTGAKAIEKGFLQAGGKANQITFSPDQTTAVESLKAYFKPQTIILFENNLPEVYN